MALDGLFPQRPDPASRYTEVLDLLKTYQNSLSEELSTKVSDLINVLENLINNNEIVGKEGETITISFFLQLHLENKFTRQLKGLERDLKTQHSTRP
jgi:hypothetical protein